MLILVRGEIIRKGTGLANQFNGLISEDAVSQNVSILMLSLRNKIINAELR